MGSQSSARATGRSLPRAHTKPSHLHPLDIHEVAMLHETEKLSPRKQPLPHDAKDANREKVGQQGNGAGDNRDNGWQI